MNDRRTESPFHEGELEAQRRAGESAEADRNSPMIGNRIMAGALDFVRQQPMVVIASRDAAGRLWSSLLFGRPGFLDPSSDRRSLRIVLDPSLEDAADPLWRSLERGSQLGLLVIELATRRRLRINGHLAVKTPERLSVEVEESFANCPKYIQRRDLSVAIPTGDESLPIRSGPSSRLETEDKNSIGRADTLFVASAHPARGIDSSHRGGNPGFVEILDEKTIRVPDYPGNSMFNTIGNFLTNPRAGLVFPDFERHRALQLTGTVEVLWEQPDDRGVTGRSWVFHLEETRRASISNAIDAHFVDYSPFNPAI